MVQRLFHLQTDSIITFIIKNKINSKPLNISFKEDHILKFPTTSQFKQIESIACKTFIIYNKHNDIDFYY